MHIFLQPLETLHNPRFFPPRHSLDQRESRTSSAIPTAFWVPAYQGDDAGRAEVNQGFLKYANRLKKAGFTPEQAEEQASALSEAFEVNLKEIATKDYLDNRLIRLEQRMTIKLGAMLTVAVGAMVALTKLL